VNVASFGLDIAHGMLWCVYTVIVHGLQLVTKREMGGAMTRTFGIFPLGPYSTRTRKNICALGEGPPMGKSMLSWVPSPT